MWARLTSTITRLWPRLFISYSRVDAPVVDALVAELASSGFRVFRDVSGISPGDNFVSTLLSEVRRSTAIVALVSDDYARSRWAQAELYVALSIGKLAILVVLSKDALGRLDDPLQRLIRDTHYAQAAHDANGRMSFEGLARLLAMARRRHRRALALRAAFAVLVLTLAGGGVWWTVGNLNALQASRRLDTVVDQIVEAKATFQHPRIEGFAAALAGNPAAVGRVMYLADDPTLTDVARFNALALGNELRKGLDTYRWYPKHLDVDRAQLDAATFVDTSFLGGAWRDSTIRNSTFSNVFWSEKEGTSLSAVVFSDSAFYGGRFEGIKAIDVSFINTKFRGTEVDTTNFSKVRFTTTRPPTEGTPIITPSFTLFERSLLISRREPPTPGVIDLTRPGDEVVFDDVMFVDCRLEGYFKAEWFRNSTFERCVLPPSLAVDDLIRAGNHVM